MSTVVFNAVIKCSVPRCACPILAIRATEPPISDAADAGTAVIIVEQFARLALDVADRAYVLVNGRVDTEGRAEDLRGNLEEIEGKYLGAD
jgi:branched-chain amino acid transport system ATP-binding protein